MESDTAWSDTLAQLRQRAEEAVQAGLLGAADAAADSSAELIHELRTHQIELELQNEDLRQAQLELSAARDRYADLYTFAPISYLTVGSDGLIQECNLLATDLLGVERERLVGRPFSQFVAGDESGPLSVHQKRVLESEATERCELHMVRATGEVFHAQLESLRQAGGGEDASYRTTITDISRLKDREQALRDSHAGMQALVEAIGDGVVVINAAGEVELCNPAATQLIGIPPADDYLAGRPDNYGVFFADTVTPVPESQLPARRALLGEAVENVELFVRNARIPDGIFVEATARRISSPGGSEDRCVVVFRDTTWRKKAEEELRDLNQSLERTVAERTGELREANDRLRVEVADRQKAEGDLRMVIKSIPHYIWAGHMDDKGRFRFTYFSPVAADVLGIQPDRFLASSRRRLRIVHGADRALVFSAIRSLLEGRSESVELEYRIKRPDGTIRWVRDSVVSRPLTDGRLSVSGVVSDITQRMNAEEGRRSAEQELAAHRAAALRSDRLRWLGGMAANMAHELGQPLAGIRSLAEHTLLATERGWELTPVTIGTRMARAIEQVDRMAHIIGQVRTLARESGCPRRSRVDVREVVRASVDKVGARFRSQGIALEVDLPGSLPAVSANPQSLEEVLLNLLSNARDALVDETVRRARTEARVVIRVRLIDQAGPHIQIDVADNGPGIPAAIQADVFDPFYTTRDPGKATGLGLSLCRTIVEVFEGSINIQSTQDAGTTVIIQLPVAASAA